MKIPGIPDVDAELAAFRDDLKAIRAALERLLELEEARS